MDVINLLICLQHSFHGVSAVDSSHPLVGETTCHDRCLDRYTKTVMAMKNSVTTIPIYNGMLPPSMRPSCSSETLVKPRSMSCVSTRVAVQRESATATMKTAANIRYCHFTSLTNNVSWGKQILAHFAQVFHDESCHDRLTHSHN